MQAPESQQESVHKSLDMYQSTDYNKFLSVYGEEDMKFDSIRAGETYYSTQRRKMGNTTLSTLSVVRIQVKSVNTEKGTVRAVWNGNPERTYFERDIAKWRLTEPMLVGNMTKRLATRAELAAMKS